MGTMIFQSREYIAEAGGLDPPVWWTRRRHIPLNDHTSLQVTFAESVEAEGRNVQSRRAVAVQDIILSAIGL